MEEKNTEKELSLHQLWKVFTRCWWIMLIAAVVVAGGYLGIWKATHTNLYTAETYLWVTRAEDNTSGGKQIDTGDVSISLASVEDYMTLMQTYPVYSAIRYDLAEKGVAVDVKDLPELIKLKNNSDSTDKSRIIIIDVTTKDPETSQIIADSVAKETCELITARLGANAGIVRWEANEGEIEVPDVPSNPFSAVVFLLLAVVAAIAVYAVFLVLDFMNDKITTVEDVQNYLGLSVLGQIPNIEDVNRKKHGSSYYSYR